MNHVLPKLRLVASGLAVAGLLSSCTLSNSDATAPTNQPIFAAPPAGNTTVSGFVWDPEAFMYSFFMCNPPPPAPPSCFAPPVAVPGLPDFDLSVVSGAGAGLFDPLQPGTPVLASALTPVDGSWALTGVTTRSDVPFFPIASPPADATTALPSGPPGYPTAPPAKNYFQSITFQPIDTQFTQCLSQADFLASDSGILQAVANYLTGNGTPTTAADFVDPTKWGGAAVVWLTQGGVYVPAFGAMVQADQGTMYYIGWAPPGVLPPALGQSDRGFYVDHVGGDAHAPMGLAVLLLSTPSATGVNFTFSDDQTGDGHPWAFPPFPTLPIPPGMVSFLNPPVLMPGPPPPPFVCLPPG